MNPVLFPKPYFTIILIFSFKFPECYFPLGFSVKYITYVPPTYCPIQLILSEWLKLMVFAECGPRGSVVVSSTMLQAARSRVRFPMSLIFFNLPNPSSHTMALGSTQSLTEMSARNLPGGKKRPARRADNLAANYEPIA
jgi:hypothetical protein